MRIKRGLNEVIYKAHLWCLSSAHDWDNLKIIETETVLRVKWGTVNNYARTVSMKSGMVLGKDVQPPYIWRAINAFILTNAIKGHYGYIDLYILYMDTSYSYIYL